MENTKMLTDEELAKELAKMTPAERAQTMAYVMGLVAGKAQAKAAEPAGGARTLPAALCASGDAVANMGGCPAPTKKPQNVTSAGIMESTHKLARACRIADATTASTPAAQKAADAYALEAALYAVAYEAARLVRSDMWPLVAMRLDEAQEVGTRTSDLHIRQPLGKLIMRRHPLAVRGSTAQNLVEELLYAAVKARQAAAGLGKRAGGRRGLRLHDGRCAELPRPDGRTKMENEGTRELFAGRTPVLPGHA